MSGSHVFVLLIIFMAFAMVIIRSWLSNKQSAPTNDAEVEEMLARIDTLEERIRVLERIVTENKIDLRQQIDNL